MMICARRQELDASSRREISMAWNWGGLCSVVDEYGLMMMIKVRHMKRAVFRNNFAFLHSMTSFCSFSIHKYIFIKASEPLQQKHSLVNN